MDERIRIISWPIEPQGCVYIYRETDKTYTVKHSDLYRVYSTSEGFKTYRAAREEANYFRK